MRPSAVFLAALLVTAPVHVLAHEPLTDLTVAALTTEGDDREERGEDEGNSRLGLLGLLGLAGLLGLLRREPDIHVDARGANRTGDQR
jgi:MYXO-CTERM domain-containing protein